MHAIKLPLVLSLVLALVACSSEQDAHADASSDAAPTNDAPKVTISPLSAPIAEGASGVAGDASDEVKMKILAKFAEVRPDIRFSSVNATSFPGLYEAEFEQGGVIYSSESGEFFVTGEIYQLKESGVVNLSEEQRVVRRKEILANLDPKELITFPVAGEDIADIYVFTDVYCGFCAKLHNDVDTLAKMGIRVNYLAYPRGGASSKAYPVMQSVWCADDRQKAMTVAKSGGTVAPAQCSSTAVLDQHELGNRVGVNGTPAIMFEDGSLMAGYREPSELAYLAKTKR